MNGRCHQTRTGLRIGRSYVAPPQSLGSEAEHIQAVLLHRRRKPLAPRWLRVLIGYLLGSRP